MARSAHGTSASGAERQWLRRERVLVKGIGIGLWPVMWFNVYPGSLSANLMSVSSAAGSRSTWRWIGSAVGRALAAGAFVLLTNGARRQLRAIENSHIPAVRPGGSA